MIGLKECLSEREKSALWTYLGLVKGYIKSGRLIEIYYFSCPCVMYHNRMREEPSIFRFSPSGLSHGIKEFLLTHLTWVPTYRSAIKGIRGADFGWMQDSTIISLITEEERLSSALLVIHSHIQISNVI